MVLNNNQTDKNKRETEPERTTQTQTNEHASHEQATHANEHNNNETQHNSQNEELNQCRQRVKQLEEQLAYLRADFENFRKNTAKEKEQWQYTIQAHMFKDLLPIIDDFSRALADLESDELSEQEAQRFQGFKLIHKELSKLLDRYEVQEITQVDTFDPHIHEAIAQVDDESKQSGDIVAVVQKGYTFKKKVLRPAKVTVAQ